MTCLVGIILNIANATCSKGRLAMQAPSVLDMEVST